MNDKEKALHRGNGLQGSECTKDNIRQDGVNSTEKGGRGATKRQPAPSNSGFCGFFKESIVMSIDRVSFTLGLPWRRSESEYSKQLWRILESRMDRGLTKYLSGNRLYDYHIQYAEGFDIQFGTKQDSGSETMRIEFNPSKVILADLVPVLEVLPWHKFHLANITRIDWAIDYKMDIDPGLFWSLGVSKYHSYYSPANGIETIYHGSPDSDWQARVYNKALEQKKHHSVKWWRLEAQCRERVGLLTPFEELKNPFTPLRYIDSMPTEGGWGLAGALAGEFTRASIPLIKCGVIKHLGRHTWRKKFEPYLTPSQSIPQPMEVFDALGKAEYKKVFGELFERIEIAKHQQAS